MLERLDDINWGNLTHARGPATNVPDLLRGLLVTDDAETREDIWGDMWMLLLHQGQVYDATAYAVPFVVELTPQLPDPHEALYWLAAAANGQASLGMCSLLVFDKSKRSVETLLSRLAQTSAAVQVARKAVYSERGVYLSLLTSGEARTKIAAALVLAQFMEHADELVPGLLQRLSNETMPEVRAALLIALGMLLARDQIDVLIEHLDEPHSLIERYGAAHALAILLRQAVPEEALIILGATLLNVDDLEEERRLLRWIVGDIRVAISEALVLVGLQRAEPYIPDIIQLVETSTPLTRIDIVQALMHLLFGRASLGQHRSAADLSRLQRRALRAIADHALQGPAGQKHIQGNVALMLRLRGLPGDPEKLRVFLED